MDLCPVCPNGGGFDLNLVLEPFCGDHRSSMASTFLRHWTEIGRGDGGARGVSQCDV